MQAGPLKLVKLPKHSNSLTSPCSFYLQPVNSDIATATTNPEVNYSEAIQAEMDKLAEERSDDASEEGAHDAKRSSAATSEHEVHQSEIQGDIDGRAKQNSNDDDGGGGGGGDYDYNCGGDGDGGDDDDDDDDGSSLKKKKKMKKSEKKMKTKTRNSQRSACDDNIPGELAGNRGDTSDVDHQGPAVSESLTISAPSNVTKAIHITYNEERARFEGLPEGEEWEKMNVQFGVPIENLPKRMVDQYPERIPAVLEMMKIYCERNDFTKVVGIFR